MSHEEALDWIRKETARRRREESGGGLVELRQPEAFSDEYAPAERLTRVRPGADPTEASPDSRIVRGLLCGACAGWGRPPTSAELYDAISSDANAPVTGPFSIAITFSQPVTGFELEDLVVPNGSASEPQGNDATYTATITPEASGTVTVDIPAGAAQDSAGNHSASGSCILLELRSALAAAYSAAGRSTPSLDRHGGGGGDDADPGGAPDGTGNTDRTGFRRSRQSSTT